VFPWCSVDDFAAGQADGNAMTFAANINTDA
jgi:hypothetical protein